jgi:hypothetical protein
MNSLISLSLSVPLGQDAHRWAEQFAAEQATPEKGKQVYLNTLSVYAVHCYLSWLSIETNLSQSNCWKPGLRAMFDVADLVLPNGGRLECRSLSPNQPSFQVPPEDALDRLGYVAVQLNAQLDSAELLGFVPASEVDSSEIAVSQCRSLDTLLDTIHQHTQLINLRDWLEGIFSKDWQPTEALFASAYRRVTIPQAELTKPNSVSRSKVIELGYGWAVVLVVRLTLTSEQSTNVWMRLYSAHMTAYLPSDLRFAIVDQGGVEQMEVRSQREDDWLQLEFQCERNERFDVTLKWDDTDITEQFVV